MRLTAVGIWTVAIVALAATGRTTELPERLAGHGGPVKGIAVSPDGGRVATASFDYSVILRD